MGDRPSAGGRRNPRMRPARLGQRTGWILMPGKRMDPHAREEARRLAREEPLAGLSPQEAVNAVRQALESGGGRMPRMLSNLLRAGNPRPPDRLSRCPE